MLDRHSKLAQRRIVEGDCIEAMAAMPEASVDSIVCDPPYGLEFMGKDWDGADGFRRSLNAADVGRDTPHGRASRTSPEYRAGRLFGEWCEAWAKAALRVLKPGGHLLAFGGTRTSHRLVTGIEDAGFEVRDSVLWLYGSGFPKSLDVSKAIDKRRDWAALRALQGGVKAAREAAGITQSEAARRMGLIGPDETLGGGGFMWFETGMRIPTREQWPALKAALSLGDEYDEAFVEAEREVVGQHAEGSAPGGFGDHRFSFNSRDITSSATPDAEKWEGWGTALKPAHEPIVMARKPLVGTVAANVLAHGAGALNVDGCRIGDGGHLQWSSPRDLGYHGGTDSPDATAEQAPHGRWPANVVMDEEAAAMLDEQTGERRSAYPGSPERAAAYEGTATAENGVTSIPQNVAGLGYSDSGGASRFFYVAKPDAEERQAGLGGAVSLFAPADAPGRNDHPTVKPIELMRWLCRLITPPGGTVLDPFAGSGTTGCAAALEGFGFIGIEREPDYARIARARLAHWSMEEAA